ncbi:asparagine--tRNA ligase [Opitutus sp. GAS368]|jgi:asparaginyl-tRNA synthetase|uniref:asparagine--tRNA ligase n=1 Tax=Opitutus sp. GAS368 TaxID=1882749 RepID=UPI00087B8A64|nr:asparagine--tRNA ligase [Opitutus sp. GAS368]SDS08124.1 asparaginyl-tRNA synthetase [Opitutus sp. GAS368]
MLRTLVKDALHAAGPVDTIFLQGWVRTRRDAKAFSFIELNDGSCLKGLQVIVDTTLPDYANVAHANTGASVEVHGKLVESKGQGQKWEVVATGFKVLGEADATYPLQKKGHTLEFLREIAHLRPRSNLFGAVFRVRSRLAYAVHQFFQERGFYYVHTPIITASDAEGAGDMFRVTTLDLENPPKLEGGKQVDNTKDFFGKKTFLTVSGQLEGEIFAHALSNVYTFGPTFRAENSNTSRHAAEFWMIEPEVAFCDLAGNMDLAEAFVKHLIRDAKEHCAADLEFFAKFVDKDLMPRLDFVLEKPFVRCSYTEAVEILGKSGKTWEHPVAWGANLQAEHERYLTEEHFKCPTTVYNYPRAIKAFYMRQNDGTAEGRETVAAMDLLVPGIGEIIGGSQREERLDKLRAGMALHHLDEKAYWWYLDLRRYGSVPHAGFGLGFERMLMFVTGVGNIRDVIPFARTPGTADF